jgi:hypothetical protein
MLKSTTKPDVPPVVITRGGLNRMSIVSEAVPLENEAQLEVTVAEQVCKVTGAGGLAEVLRTVNCGLVSVSESDSYVPWLTFPKLRMFVKSTKLAKSTCPLGPVIVADVPPPCGTRAAELIVTRNDCTSQLGWSVPKTTSDPDALSLAGEGAVLLPPHPTITNVAKPMANASNNTQCLLFMPSLLERFNSRRVVYNSEVSF